MKRCDFKVTFDNPNLSSFDKKILSNNVKSIRFNSDGISQNSNVNLLVDFYDNGTIMQAIKKFNTLTYINIFHKSKKYVKAHQIIFQGTNNKICVSTFYDSSDIEKIVHEVYFSNTKLS